VYVVNSRHIEGGGETHVRKSLLLSYGSRGAVPPQLTAILHLKHAAVGAGAEHLSIDETQYGYMLPTL